MVMLKSVPKVVILNTITSLDIPAIRVLEDALKQDLKDVVILAKQKDGEYYFASSVADGGTVLWMFEKLKDKLLGYNYGAE
jgi:hypothetical protein